MGKHDCQDVSFSQFQYQTYILCTIEEDIPLDYGIFCEFE